MQQPPPTDPKTDLQLRCMWCGYLSPNPCQEDSDIEGCFYLNKYLKKTHYQEKRYAKSLIANELKF